MLTICGNRLQERLLGLKNNSLIFGTVLKVSIFAVSQKMIIHNKTKTGYEQS